MQSRVVHIHIPMVWRARGSGRWREWACGAASKEGLLNPQALERLGGSPYVCGCSSYVHVWSADVSGPDVRREVRHILCGMRQHA